MTFEDLKEALVKFRPELAKAGVRISTIIPTAPRNLDAFCGLDKFREASDRVLAVEVLYESSGIQTPGKQTLTNVKVNSFRSRHDLLHQKAQTRYRQQDCKPEKWTLW